MATIKNKIGNIIDTIKCLFSRKETSGDLIQNKQGDQPKAHSGLRLMTENEMRNTGSGPDYY